MGIVFMPNSSAVSNSVTPWAVARQVSLSLQISRQEHWNGCHLLLQGSFPAQGWNPHLSHLLHWQAGSLSACHPGKPAMRITGPSAKKSGLWGSPRQPPCLAPPYILCYTLWTCQDSRNSRTNVTVFKTSDEWNFCCIDPFLIVKINVFIRNYVNTRHHYYLKTLVLNEEKFYHIRGLKTS